MVSRLMGLYVLAEFVVVVALVWAVGFWWTLLILLAALIVGFVVSGSQLSKQLELLRSGTMTTSQGALTDGVLGALGSLLMVIPGLVTSVIGALLLFPPTRFVIRPVVVFLALRALNRRMPLNTVAAGAGEFHVRQGGPHGDYDPRGDYIDGEVLDVKDIDPSPTPPTTAPGAPPSDDAAARRADP